MRKFGKKDANQTEIVTALRKLGFSVAITSSMGDGFPDLVVAGSGRCAKAYSPVLLEKRTILIELKDQLQPPSKRKLTDDEKKFHDSWKGEIITATCLDDILNAFKG